jgi:hypothetical protein
MSILTTDGVLHDDGTLVTNKFTAQRGICYGGQNSLTVWTSYNLVTNFGYIGADISYIPYSSCYRYWHSGASFGSDKAIFAGGFDDNDDNRPTNKSIIISNLGIPIGDTSYSSSITRRWGAAAGYGGDKAIFGYGNNYYGATYLSVTNLVSNTGVYGSDVAGVGTARYDLDATVYGTDKAIFGYGYTGSYTSLTNLVSNSGVVASDTTGVGTARSNLAAASYGGDKAIFGYGYTSTNYVSMTNLVSNSGFVASDTTGVGTARSGLAAAGYGGDKAIFAYGYSTATSYTNISNKVSNTGVVASDTTGVGSTKTGPGASYAS